MKRTERHVYTYDLVVSARAQHATPPSLSAIAEAWQHMFNEGLCSHERERGTVVYRIGALQIDYQNDVLRLLIRRCDINASNAVYSHKHTGVQRVAEKEADEGGDRAAHMILSLRAGQDQPHHYLCHLEGMPGLNHRLVQATLNSILKAAARRDQALFQYPDPGGARVRGGGAKLTSFMPEIELQGHPSPDLVQDIENGVISDIRLVTNQAHNNLGGNQYLTESEYQLKVRVNKNIPKGNRVGSLIEAFRARGADFQTARVRFTDPGGVSRTVEYDIETGTPEQQQYVLSYFVRDINPPMDESSEDLCTFLTNVMQQRVLAGRA